MLFLDNPLSIAGLSANFGGVNKPTNQGLTSGSLAVVAAFAFSAVLESAAWAQPAPPPPPQPAPPAPPSPTTYTPAPQQPYGYSQPAPRPYSSQESKKKGRVELSPVIGYKWWGTMEIVGGDLEIDSSPSYGAVLNVQAVGSGKANSMIELHYSRQDTTLRLDPGIGPSVRLFDLAVEHYQIGGVGEIVQPAGGEKKVVPFTVGTLGMTRYSAKAGGIDDEYKFSFTFGLGVKVKINPRMGLRFHGRLITTLINTSAGLFCGTGGCAGSVSGDTVFQSELGAAFVLAL